MTAMELNTMVNAMRSRRNKITDRSDVSNTLFYLSKGLHAIKRYDLAEKLSELYADIENIDIDELLELGTFPDVD